MPVNMIVTVLIFITLDVVIGLIKALSTGTYKSLKMRDGLYHKIGEILTVGFGIFCENAFPYVGIEIKIPIVSTICIYIVLMETGSIVENLAIISPNIKNMLGKVFGDFRNEDEE